MNRKKKQFHEKFLNLILLFENKEYFKDENKHIFRILFLAFDDNYEIYYKNMSFFHSSLADVPNSIIYSILKNMEINWIL